MKYKFRKTTVITGYYGCGKTNLAVNIAMHLKKTSDVSITDIDIVNPYFRTADFREMLGENGIITFIPEYAGTNVDIPVLNFNMEHILESAEYSVIDTGGDDAGAYALGGYRSSFLKRADSTDVFYVWNMYRRPDLTADDIIQNIRDIEKASSLKITALINNSNLGPLTDAEVIARSFEMQDTLTHETGIEHAFTCVPCEVADEIGTNEKIDIFPVSRYVKLPWE